MSIVQMYNLLISFTYCVFPYLFFLLQKKEIKQKHLEIEVKMEEIPTKKKRKRDEIFQPEIEPPKKKHKKNMKEKIIDLPIKPKNMLRFAQTAAIIEFKQNLIKYEEWVEKLKLNPEEYEKLKGKWIAYRYDKTSGDNCVLRNSHYDIRNVPRALEYPIVTIIGESQTTIKVGKKKKKKPILIEDDKGSEWFGLPHTQTKMWK